MDCGLESIGSIGTGASASSPGGSYGSAGGGESIVSRKIVSEPDAAIQVIELSLSSSAAAGLRTGVAKLGWFR